MYEYRDYCPICGFFKRKDAGAQRFLLDFLNTETRRHRVIMLLCVSVSLCSNKNLCVFAFKIPFGIFLNTETRRRRVIMPLCVSVSLCSNKKIFAPLRPLRSINFYSIILTLQKFLGECALTALSLQHIYACRQTAETEYAQRSRVGGGVVYVEHLCAGHAVYAYLHVLSLLQ